MGIQGQCIRTLYVVMSQRGCLRACLARHLAIEIFILDYTVFLYAKCNKVGEIARGPPPITFQYRKDNVDDDGLDASLFLDERTSRVVVVVLLMVVVFIGYHY